MLKKIQRLLRQNSENQKTKKTWTNSQSYELRHAVQFMERPEFREISTNLKNGDQLSEGYASELILKEFFNSDLSMWQEFTTHITNKICIDIGPCALSPIMNWDLASQRHVIEPLLDSIVSWQNKNMGWSVFDGLVGHSVGGEVLVNDLVGKVDGAIYCRNCIDHSPKWPFILSNISHYAAPGCHLLLWNDIDHHGQADDGHYDITDSTDEFKRLIQALGFDIVTEYEDLARPEKNWGCMAIKSKRVSLVKD